MKSIMTPELIRCLIDHTPVAYVILDDSFRIRYINDYFLKLRNLRMAEIVGKVCYAVSNGGVMCSRCAVRQTFESGKKTMLQRKDVMPDGAIRFVDDYAVPLNHAAPDGEKFVLEIMVNRTEEMLALEQRDRDYLEIVRILLLLLDAKDAYTATHSDSVAKLAVKLGRKLNLGEQELFDLSVAASLHDLGKVRIPEAILTKKGKLDEREYQLIKNHPADSSNMLQGLSSFENIQKTVLHHHEWYDGSGYPAGLSGEEIPLGARIIAVADTFDAITSTRSYRMALIPEFALEEIRRCAGSQLDPLIAAVFPEIDFTADNGEEAVRTEPAHQITRALSTEAHPAEGRNALADNPLANIDLEILLNEVFANTPCGYIVMDTDLHILLANSYLLEYMGLDEGDMAGKTCYRAGGFGEKPCPNCPIRRAIASGKIEKQRMEQTVRGSLKIFDMYAVPLRNADGNIRYMAEIIIDRTREALVNREREKDFAKLIDLLSTIWQEQVVANRENMMTEKIAALQEKLNVIMKAKDAAAAAREREGQLS